MPIQLLALAKTAGLVKTASKVLADWRMLEPDQKASVREPGVELMELVNELRRAVGARLFHEDAISWDEARALALDPSMHFLLARRVVEVVQAHERIAVEAVAHELGAAGVDDGIFRRALDIAAEDGYIRYADDETVEVTDFADGQLASAEHIAAIERVIGDYVEETGLAAADALAEVVGAESAEAPEFRAALERALDSGRVHWLEAGLYGLTPERLEDFAPVVDLVEDDAPREVKAIAADVARAADRLRVALAAVRQNPALVALPAAPVVALPPARDDDPLERLAKLKQLLDAGALNEQEFAEQKARLLTAL